MAVETGDVLDGSGNRTAVRVTYIDPQSRRYQADIPIAQATSDAVAALAASLQAQSVSLQPAASTTDPSQALTAAAVQQTIAPTASDNSPPINPPE